MKTYNFKSQRRSKVDKCVTTVFYVRRPFVFRFITKHQRRRQWKRRKHNFEYILYLNILSLWATEYVFCRKLVKFNYNYCIMRSSLVVYNLALLRGTSPSLAKNSEHTYIATLPKLLIKYYTRMNYNLFKYWYQPSSTPLIISSYFINESNMSLKQTFKTCFIHPSYVYSTSSLSPYYENFNKHLLGSYEDLFHVLLLKHHYSMLSEIYKVHILLILNCIHVENRI